MNHRSKVVLALSMLLSAHHGMNARYLNYDRILQVVAKLKVLGKDTEKIEMFEKNFKSNYVNSWFLMPREYNKLLALMLDLLDTADSKAPTPKEKILQVLEMLDNELKGLINCYGYQKELVALSYRTSELRLKITQGTLFFNMTYAAELKRLAQDLLAESLLTESSAESIVRCVKDHTKKIEEKEKEQKRSQPIEPNPYEETDRKS